MLEETAAKERTYEFARHLHQRLQNIVAQFVVARIRHQDVSGDQYIVVDQSRLRHRKEDVRDPYCIRFCRVCVVQ